MRKTIRYDYSDDEGRHRGTLEVPRDATEQDIRFMVLGYLLHIDAVSGAERDTLVYKLTIKER